MKKALQQSSPGIVVKVSCHLFVFCSFFMIPVSATLSCPINFTYVENYGMELSPCQKDPYAVNCCKLLLPVVFIGFVQYLRDSSTFFLPTSYAPSCLSSLQGKLSSAGIDPYSVPLCFKNLSSFAGNDSGCPGIATLEDWQRKVGSSSILLFNSSCRGDLSNATRCEACLDATQKAVLGSDFGESIVRCFTLATMYAAGISNEYGPLDNRTSGCLMSTLRDGLEPDEKQPPKDSRKRRVLELGFGIAGGVLLVVIGVLVLMYKKKLHCCRKERDLDSEHASSSNNPSDMMLAKMGLQWFRLLELERATDGFSQKNLVGKGTFGVVYRGKLEEDGSLVAVKELLEVECFGNDKEFTNEVEIVSKIKHRNLLPLIGCCVDTKGKKRFLVYQFMANGSVADHLSNMPRRVQLCWEQRKNIILDVAKGIVYLHCGVKPAIYHRDIKSSNILLDIDLRAKVADFGLARQGKEDAYSHLTTRVAGTHGFLAPEYAMYGHLSHKTDVYSFGVLILEIMTARKVIDTSSSNSSSPVLITDWVWDMVKSGKVEEVFDEAMKEDYQSDDGEMMTRFVMVGVLCAHIVANHRPTITEALRMLEGGIDVPKTPERPLLMSR